MAREFNMARLAKLHRSRNNRLVAGVLGGIAEYVGWSPTNVRILFWVIIILSAFCYLANGNGSLWNYVGADARCDAKFLY